MASSVGNKDIYRILHIYPRLEAGGLEQVIANITRALPAPDFQHDILTLEPGNPIMESLLLDRGCRIFRLDGGPKDNSSGSKYQRNIRNFLTDRMKIGEGYNAVHAHHHPNMHRAAMAAKQVGIPVRILHSHLAHPDKSFLRRLITRIPYLRHSRGATHLLGCSDEALHWIFPGGGGNRGRILANGIDPERYRFDAQTRLSMRRKVLEKFGLDEETPIILNIGRCTPQKNQSFILDIAECIEYPARFPEFNIHPLQNPLFIICGDGELRNNLIEECSKRDLRRVWLPGHIRDIEKWLSMADLLLTPSLYEGSPLTAVEAQASGLPVIESEAVPEISDAGIGLLRRLPLNNILRWIAAIGVFLPKSAENRQLLSQQFAESIACRESTIEGMSDYLKEIYNVPGMPKTGRRVLIEPRLTAPAGHTGGDIYDRMMFDSASTDYKCVSFQLFPDKKWADVSPLQKLLSPFRMLLKGMRVHKEFQRRGYETKWLFNTSKCLYTSLLAKHLTNRGIETLSITHHPEYLQREGWRRRIYKRAERWMLRNIRKPIAASQYTARLLSEEFGIGVRLLRIPLLKTAKEIDNSQPTDHREDAKHQPGEFRLIFIGSIERRKGIHYLLEAADILSKKGLNVKVVIVGRVADVAYHQELKEMAQRIPAEIVFRGLVAENEKDRILRESDALVLPSAAEGYGMVLTEGMAAGIPVVAFRNTGMIDVVGENEERGLLADPGDAASLARCIDRLATSAPLREKLIAEGLRFASSLPSREDFDRDLKRILES